MKIVSSVLLQPQIDLRKAIWFFLSNILLVVVRILQTQFRILRNKMNSLYSVLALSKADGMSLANGIVELWADNKVVDN